MADIKDSIGQRIAFAGVAFTHNIFGMRSFELNVFDKYGKKLGTQIVPMDFLKAEGITYTLNGKKQVNTWANSEAGLKWLRDNYGTDAKHITQVQARKVLAESERRKLPSLTTSEVDSFIMQGVRAFHNGGVRKRFVVGSGLWIGYKTKEDGRGTSAEPLNNFAKWCKGVILTDGTVLTKGDVDPADWEAYVNGTKGKERKGSKESASF